MEWVCNSCGFTSKKGLLNCPLCGDILILFDCEVIENAINS